MSSEVFVNDTLTLGSNKPAWHGIGKLFAGLLSPLRVFAEGVGARDILEVPVFAAGLEVPGAKGLVALHSNGNRTALSVVAKSYGVLKDLDFFNILQDVYGGQAVVETAGTLRNGRRVWCLVRRDTWDVTAGDKVEAYDLWVNRHDGSGCYELHSTNVRVVCGNTWRLALGSGRNRVFGVRHTTNVLAAAKAAAEIVKKSREQEVFAREQVRSLANRRVSETVATGVFRRVLGVAPETAFRDIPVRTQASLGRLQELFVRGAGNEGRTAWDAFNAVTEFVDHNRVVRASGGRSRAEARFESTLLGNGDDLKATAYDLLLAI